MNSKNSIIIIIMVALILLMVKFVFFDTRNQEQHQTNVRIAYSNISYDTITKNGFVKNYITTTNQIVSQGLLKNGLKDSVWLYYNEQGLLIESVNYINDKKDGTSLTYYSNNHIHEKYSYTNNLLNGKFEKYYEDGKTLKEKGEYLKGILNGINETFLEDGYIESKVNYVKGCKNGLYEEYDIVDGRHILTSIGFYKNNLKDSLWKHYNLYYDFESKQFTNKIILLATDNYKNDKLNGMSTTYDQVYGFKIDETMYVDDAMNGISRSYCPNGVDRGKLYIVEEYKDNKLVNKLPYQCKCKSVIYSN